VPKEVQSATSSAKITIDSISPSHGPVTGDTRVIVRGGPFGIYASSNPTPKCRFGADNMIVMATYVNCPAVQPKIYEKEGKKANRTAVCLQCENSPASLESKPVEFTVSLAGDFADVSSSAQFYYYKASRVTAIKPRFGPKDGDTTI